VSGGAAFRKEGNSKYGESERHDEKDLKQGVSDL